MKFKINGIPKVTAYLTAEKLKISNNAEKALTKAAIYLQGEVKSSIAGQRDEKQSVDTGRFLNSVDISAKKDEAKVFSNVPYANFLENGTSKFPARKHFKNSKNRNREKIREIIKKEL